MKQTLGLLLALMIGCSLSVVAQQVTSPETLEFGQGDDLLIDPAAFKQLDAIEKNTSLTAEIRMAARCLLAYAKMKAVKLKDTASVHIKEHKKAYITGLVAVTAAVILLCWLRRMYASKIVIQQNNGQHPDIPQSDSGANNVVQQVVKPVSPNDTPDIFDASSRGSYRSMPYGAAK